MPGDGEHCSGDCARCPVLPAPVAAPYRGPALAWRAAAFFLAPPIGALVGAIAAGVTDLAAWGGASLGFVIGAAGAALVARGAASDEPGEVRDADAD